MDFQKEKICPTCKQRTITINRKAEGPGWELWEGDSLRLMRTIVADSIAAVITDPPYGSGGDSISARMRPSKTKYVSSDSSYQDSLPDIDGDALRPEAWNRNMKDFFEQTVRVLRPDGVFICFIDWRNIGELINIIAASSLRLRGVVVWDKRNGRPYRGGFRMQTEYILWGSKDKLPRTDFYGPGIISQQTKTGGKIHITEKPIELMAQLVEVCPKGGRILDPFAGSSTTGVAAVQSGRKFLGIESVPGYFDISEDRLRGGKF